MTSDMATLPVNGIGSASILSTAVPEPTAYEGTNIIELQFPEDWFEVPGRQDPLSTPGVLTLVNVDIAMLGGFRDQRFFPLVKLVPGTDLWLSHGDLDPPEGTVRSNLPLGPGLLNLKPKDVFAALSSKPRQWLTVYQTPFGLLDCRLVSEVLPRPRILLIELCRLTSYLGSYGPGRTLKTLSLLPGEKTRLSIKTYSREEKSVKNATSVLDSFTEDSANDFENSVQTEQSDKQASAENLSYYAEAEASMNWGVFSASVKAGVKGGSNSSREEFAKNVAHATEKHAARASSKRDVQINTTEDSKTQTGLENTIERDVQNINVSHTLNFIFRQMNQEFVTLLHLVDVRVAYFDGDATTKREVALHDLDSLIEQFIKDNVSVGDNFPEPSIRVQVRRTIIDELENIFDYENERRSLIEERVVLRDPSGPASEGNVVARYVRVKKGIGGMSTYSDVGETEIKVPGIILSADKHVMRTDGVMVDAVLGTGDGLDTYSHGLQDESVRTKHVLNQKVQSLLAREELGRRVIADEDEASAKLYVELFQAPPPARNGAPVPLDAHGAASLSPAGPGKK